MAKTYDRPTKIQSINDKTDYIMFIDENGSSASLANIVKKIKNGETVSIDEQYFTITGCIFTKEQYNKAEVLIDNLKNRHWKDGKFYDNKLGKEKAVCLHSREIRKHFRYFNDDVINYEEFMVDLSSVMKELECIIISISIDLHKYVKNEYKYDVYNVALDFLIERYIYATNNHKKGVIILESRGKEEDKKLLKHIGKVINITGTKKISSKELKSKIEGVFFNPKINKETDETYTGLEIADLYSYPIHKFIKRNTKDRAFMTYEEKIFGYPDYYNKGIKVFPKK